MVQVSDTERQRRPADIADDDYEANVFAVYLLMPEGMFEKDAEGVDLTDDAAINRLARKYRVPVGAVCFRATLMMSRRADGG